MPKFFTDGVVLSKNDSRFFENDAIGESCFGFSTDGALAESKKMAHIADHHLHFSREYNQHFLECRKNRFGPAGYKYSIEYNRDTQQMKELGIETQQDSGSNQ